MMRCRAIAKLLAAMTGLLLIYGMVFALEGMTTRVPRIAFSELSIEVLGISPWLLLFFSGVHDLVNVTRKEWIIWLCAAAVIFSLYYFDHYTSLLPLTKAVMPPVAVGIALLPHYVRKLDFLFVLSSLGVGAAGVFLLYQVAATLVSPTTHFATKTIGALIATFCMAGVAVGVLTSIDLYHCLRRRFA